MSSAKFLRGGQKKQARKPGDRRTAPQQIIHIDEAFHNRHLAKHISFALPNFVPCAGPGCLLCAEHAPFPVSEPPFRTF